MTPRISFRSALLGGCTAMLAAMPATLDPLALDLHAKAAAARGKGGDGGGHGNGGGSRGENGGRGHGPGDSGGGGRGATSHAEAGGRGKGADGTPAHDARFADAQDRYRGALGHQRSVGQGLKGREAVTPAATLDAAQTASLIGLGWEPPAPTFRNHGQRVRTMVALAKELGYPASVGAMQANFGTPFENGVASLTVELETASAAASAAPTDPSLQLEVARLEAALAAAVAAMPASSFAGWSAVDLDVTDDGVVDAADLEAARAAPPGEPGTPAP